MHTFIELIRGQIRLAFAQHGILMPFNPDD